MGLKVLNLKEMIAPEFLYVRWQNCPARYRVCYGARNTGKSLTMVMEMYDKILTDRRRNIVVFRAVFSDIEKTVRKEVIKGLERLGLTSEFAIKQKAMEIVYKRTGQRIIFAGCDRGTAINGVQASVGEITDFYFEEAFELTDYQLFRQIDGSLRGEFYTHIEGNGLYIPKQVTFMLNPWSAEGCWIYDIFVKKYLPDRPDTQEVLEKKGFRLYKDMSYVGSNGFGLCLFQSTYLVNKWRDKKVVDVAAKFERENMVRDYQVEKLGMWGVSGDVVYPYFKDKLIVPQNVIKELDYRAYFIGVDTAYSNGEGKLLSGTALDRARIHHAYTVVLCGITRTDYKGIPKGSIIALDEYYHSQEISGVKKTQDELYDDTINTIVKWFSDYQRVPSLFRSQTIVCVDSADAGALGALETRRRERRLLNIRFEKSYKWSINTRIRYENTLMGHGKMFFGENCVNLIREVRNCREGKGRMREDINDHAINAWEYGSAHLYSMAREWENFKVIK